jgi:hypothetical protein
LELAHYERSLPGDERPESVERMIARAEDAAYRVLSLIAKFQADELPGRQAKSVARHEERCQACPKHRTDNQSTYCGFAAPGE